MSVKIMTGVWEYGPSGSAETMVLLALADFCNDEGECWPSVSTIARKARMTERGIQKIFARLVHGGWMEVDARKGRHGCNLYRVITPNAVRPERHSPPERGSKNPERGSKNPEPCSPEPSITIIEPSEERPAAVAAALSSLRDDRPPPKARLPSDWILSDKGWAYARSQQIPDEVIEDEARGFHAYWTDRRDRDASKSAVGWEQCWANRVRAIASRYAHRQLAFGAGATGHGRGGGIAGAAARRRLADPH